ncbi:hypothetical protein KJ682_18635, partial [bacterium]|nr:hypothetical protein [bacterium]
MTDSVALIRMRTALLALAMPLVLMATAGFLATLDPLEAGPALELLSALRLHLAVLAVGIGILLAALGSRIALWFVALPALAVGLEIGVTGWMRCDPPTSVSADATRIEIVTFNITNANLANGQAIASFLLEVGADIAFIQEARPLAPYVARLRQGFPHVVGCPEGGDCDTLLLSRYPLSDSEII